MDYKKKYEEALLSIRQRVESGLIEQCYVEDAFPELRESEESKDEQLRKELINAFKEATDSLYMVLTPSKREAFIAWLEEQGEHANFRNKIQIGDKVTRNQDGMLVNLSQLNRVAKKDEKQGGQKLVDKIESKFKAGDWVVVDDGRIGRIIECTKHFADVDLDFSRLSTRINNIRSWTIQDAKDGDVLATEDWVFIFEKMNSNEKPVCYCHYDIELGFRIDTNSYIASGSEIYPATKEQRDLLFQKMKEAGYEWEAEKKKLRKIEDVSAWSEKDKERYLSCLQRLGTGNPEQPETINSKWFKEHVYPQKKWKPSDEQMDALENAIRYGEEESIGILSLLYNDLKKLREE